MPAVLPVLDVALLPTDEAGPGAMVTPRGALPLAEVVIEARVEGLLADVSVRQAFVNAFPEPLEAVYVFPLPSRAAVQSFRLEVAGRVVDGVLKEKNQARRTYARALKAGHRAALAEEERPGVFTMKVGNLPPGERAVVHLRLSGPLPVHEGEATFRFPLVVAPRYSASSPLPPQTPVGTAGSSHAVDLALVVEVPESSLAPHSFRSSLHTVEEETAGTGKRFRLVPGERMDRDFILRWRIAADRVRPSLLVDDGTFLLTLVPPDLEGKQRPRDLVFVLDRSGSMSGWKLVAARRALCRMIDTLTESDRFAVYAFDDSLETPPGFDGTALVPASDAMRDRAGQWLAKIDARGGTEMALPLARATAELVRQPGDGVERVLVLVTDGQVDDEGAILKALGGRLQGIRTFALGIDRAVNEAFLRRLSELGGGRFELVESEERLDAVMDGIHRAIGTPVLTGLSLEGMGIEAGSVTPARLPDLFAGAPVMVSGRCKGGAAMVVRGMAGTEPMALTVEAQPAPRAPLGALWARGRIRDLEDQMAQSRGVDLRAEIVRVSLTHQVLSNFTSFVAVDRIEAPNPGGEVREVVQPVDAPSGWGKADAYSANAAADAMDYDEGGLAAEMLSSRTRSGGAPVCRASLPAAPRSLRRRDALTAPPAAPTEQETPQPGARGGFWAGVKTWLGFGSGSEDLPTLVKRAAVLLASLENGGDLMASLAELKAIVQSVVRLGTTGPKVEALARAVAALDLGLADPSLAEKARLETITALKAWLA